MLFLSKIYHNLYSLRDKFLYVWSEIFSWNKVRAYLILIALSNLSIWVFSWLFYRQVKEDLIILHYNIDFGVDLIGAPKNIFIIPALGFSVAFFNFLLLFIFAKRSDFKIICHLVLGTALLVNFFLLLTLGPLYIINFN